MIHELVKYARRQCPDSEPGFAAKEVRWAVSVNGSGEYLGLLELGDTTARLNRGKRFSRAPDLSQGELIARGEVKSHFLVETLAVVAGFGKSEEVAKSRAKRDFFISTLRRAATCLPGLAAAASVLEDPAAMGRLCNQLTEAKAKSTDKATFCIDGAFPLESDAWHDWWRAFRASLAPPAASADKMLCLVTGDAVQPVATHPKIGGLPGANPSGAALIGFDKDAFQSYGLEQSANAAMSAETAKAYQSGLNDLIRNHSTRLGDVVVVHWYRATVPVEDDPLSWLEEQPEHAEADARIRAQKLLTAIREGARPDLAGNTYYALALSGNGGRAMVRDWMEGDFESLADAVNAWFDDLAMVRPDGGGIAAPPRFFALRCALVRDPKKDVVPAPLAAKLFRAAVGAEPIPFTVMAQALLRARVDFMSGDASSPARMGLIRAYFARQSRLLKGTTEMMETVQPELTEGLVSPAYQCGRLMAVLASVQRAALVDVGADVIQRYYAAASSTPALVFGRLVRGAQFHLGKLRPGLAWWYEERIADICGRIGTSMPAILTLEEQGLFALGYYQQLAAQRAPKENGKAEGEK